MFKPPSKTIEVDGLVIPIEPVLAIVGRNGVGKTTLLRTLAALLPNATYVTQVAYVSASRRLEGICHLDDETARRPLCVDNIEAGLHPTTQEVAVKALGAGRTVDNPLIFTTHSPFCLGDLDYENVLVLMLDRASKRHAVRLADWPYAERFAGVLGAGEIWTAYDDTYAAWRQAVDERDARAEFEAAEDRRVETRKAAIERGEDPDATEAALAYTKSKLR